MSHDYMENQYVKKFMFEAGSDDDLQVSSIFCLVVVAVADKRAFPVVVKIRIRDGDVIGSSCDIDQSVIVIFVMVAVVTHVDVVDPNILGVLDRNRVFVSCKHL